MAYPHHLELDAIISTASALHKTGRYKDALNTINVGLIFYPRNPHLIRIFKEIPIQYDADFFSEAYEVSFKSAQLYFEHLSLLYNFQTIIDVGAGAGAWSHAAIEAGKQPISVDGKWVDKIEKKCDKLNYYYQDLNESLNISIKGDLAVCVEVAEHLDPDRSHSFIEDLCSIAPVIVFGAALPRQGGSGHINCHPHSYWIDIFKQNGYYALDAFRSIFWYDGRVGPWYTQNTFLFVRDEFKQKFSNIPEPSIINIYHPKIVADSPSCVQDHQNGIIDPGFK